MVDLPNRPIVIYPNAHDPPRHVLEGLFQGASELSNSTWYGMHAAMKQPMQHAAREGLLGAGKGLIGGAFSLAESVLDGALSMTSYIVEGVRNTPDALADYMVGEERPHYRHTTDGQEGRMLETYLERQPKHLPDGVVLGSKAVGNGLVDGTTSLIMNNIEAVGGLYSCSRIPLELGKGLVAGVAGLTAKTTASSLDIAEAVVDGARNTPDYVRCEVLPRVELGKLRLASAGVEAIVGAAHRAGDIERRIRGQAGSAWQHRPGSYLGLRPLGAPPEPPVEAHSCSRQQCSSNGLEAHQLHHAAPGQGSVAHQVYAGYLPHAAKSPPLMEDQPLQVQCAKQLSSMEVFPCDESGARPLCLEPQPVHFTGAPCPNIAEVSPHMVPTAQQPTRVEVFPHQEHAHQLFGTEEPSGAVRPTETDGPSSQGPSAWGPPGAGEGGAPDTASGVPAPSLSREPSDGQLSDRLSDVTMTTRDRSSWLPGRRRFSSATSQFQHRVSDRGGSPQGAWSAPGAIVFPQPAQAEARPESSRRYELNNWPVSCPVPYPAGYSA
mmetsp:Transcript_32741/g.90431  ORF Transcript_32741/g.90431 Transcript_32741/m.90431 type:complete len:549 (-) Transcript_32741:175-1821(-)